MGFEMLIPIGAILALFALLWLSRIMWQGNRVVFEEVILTRRLFDDLYKLVKAGQLEQAVDHFARCTQHNLTFSRHYIEEFSRRIDNGEL